VYFGAVVGLYRAYPNLDINKYASAKGVTMVQDIGTRCLGGTLEGQPELLTKYAFQKGSTYLKDPNFLNLPEMQAINLENTMGQRVPKAPVYIAEGTADELMPIADVDNLVATYCAAGTPVQYNRVSGGDHITVGLGYSVLINYALDRLNGKAVPTTCP
jgi:acetyl esterase/lipase